MRTLAAMALALALAACADGPSPDGGVATYDALRKAHDDCAAAGGVLTLKDGGDSREIEDYTCKRP